MNALGKAINRLLLSHGPLSVEDLHSKLLAEGATAAKTTNGVQTRLRSASLCLQLPDGRWDSALRRLNGATATTRPRSLLRDNVLWPGRDLELFELLDAGDGIPLSGGGVARRGASQVTTWVGPAGWIPQLAPGELLAVRWEGASLELRAIADVPPLDDPRVSDVRVLLRKHAEVAESALWAHRVASLGQTIFSALLEVPDLLQAPLPPFSELLPLPESLWPATASGGPSASSEGVPTVLALPSRVFHELDRRATLLGDRLPDYAAMLLGAACDRVLPPARDADCGCRWAPSRYDRYDRYEGYDYERAVPGSHQDAFS